MINKHTTTTTGFAVQSHIRAGSVCIWYDADADSIADYMLNKDIIETKFTILSQSCDDVANIVDAARQSTATT